MREKDTLTGELLDEVTLTLEELAQACQVEPNWVLDHVEAGVLSGTLNEPAQWSFVSADLVRAKTLISIERDFDANQELAALVADLIEEIKRLKTQLKVAVREL
jgi:chaperone modulatory protein CbpM